MPLIGAFKPSIPDIEMNHLYVDNHKNALKRGDPLHHFSLHTQGKPVLFMTLYLCPHTGSRIDDFGTLPEFQRKGYAKQLMNHALAVAKQSGLRYCFLETTPAGLRLYQKMDLKSCLKIIFISERDGRCVTYNTRNAIIYSTI